AEDGIRDSSVTGVQTCALPILISLRWGTGTVAIAAPCEVDAIMRSVPRGKLITINEIRQIIATKHGATMGCPMTTGIFAWIAARSEERRVGKECSAGEGRDHDK